jgi:hypothetical protein
MVLPLLRHLEPDPADEWDIKPADERDGTALPGSEERSFLAAERSPVHLEILGRDPQLSLREVGPGELPHGRARSFVGDVTSIWLDDSPQDYTAHILA